MNFLNWELTAVYQIIMIWKVLTHPIQIKCTLIIENLVLTNISTLYPVIRWTTSHHKIASSVLRLQTCSVVFNNYLL